MNRVFHPFNKWEDFEQGMYETTCFLDDSTMISECESLLKCKEWLWESMVFVSHNWKHAAEHNLTNLNRNRQAWLGQAACCFAHRAPEYITKKAWNNLSPQDQEAANAVADEVLKDWEYKYERDLFEWRKSN